MNALYLLSYLGTAVLTGFNIDRLIWDMSKSHLADTDSLQYVSWVTSFNYVINLGASIAVSALWLYFRQTDALNIAWIQRVRTLFLPRQNH